MRSRQVQNLVVLGLASLAAIPAIFLYATLLAGKSLHWLNGIGGTIMFLAVFVGLPSGFIGGIVLASVRREGFWLLLSLLSIILAFFWLFVAVGVGIGSMR